MAGHSNQDNPGVITIPPLIYVAALLIGLVVHYFVPVQLLAETLRIWIGVGLILIAVAIVLTTLWLLFTATAGVAP